MLRDRFEALEVGDWYFHKSGGRLYLCGLVGHDPHYPSDSFSYNIYVDVPIVEGSATGRAWWGWNGSREKPTLTPSILLRTMCDPEGNYEVRWHGWLREGEFISV